MLNLYNDTTDISFEFIGGNGKNDALGYDAFELTSYPNVINSRDMYLNGKLIEMMDDDTLPALKPVTVTSTISMKPLTYSFVVVRNVNASACY